MSHNHDLSNFIESASSLLREVEEEDLNIRQNQNRCEFYANRIQAALVHV